MQFTSFAFLIYLPTVFAIYWLLRNTVRLQNLFVVACSCLFYAWADWHYLFIIVGYTAVSFLSGILLERTETPWKRKLILWSIVAANIGVLGIYKYFDFFVENFNRFFLAAGVPLDWPTLNLLLPVGISFFTFQALGYTVDVYQRKIGPEHDVVAFFAFMTFFPQILAGPIERASAMLPQFLAKRRFTYTKGVEGMKYILWGLFKKMVIADNCGVVVDNVFNGYDTAEPLPLLIASVMFTFQIYCDFSGYSTIAIGCGKLLGIELSENFRLPLLSRNVKEIWSRWHITLYAWFRDYVYYPLGGSRRGMAITIVNIMIVFARAEGERKKIPGVILAAVVRGNDVRMVRGRICPVQVSVDEHVFLCAFRYLLYGTDPAIQFRHQLNSRRLYYSDTGICDNLYDYRNNHPTPALSALFPRQRHFCRPKRHCGEMGAALATCHGHFPLRGCRERLHLLPFLIQYISLTKYSNLYYILASFYC